MALEAIKQIASAIALTDDALSGDSVVEQIRELKTTIDELEVELKAPEPWLIQWLTAEHYCGSVLYTAAKVNKNKWGANESNPGGPKSRVTIIARFNGWALRLRERTEAYERAPYGLTVQPWRIALEQFKQDPIANDG